MQSKADKALEEAAKACQNPLLVAIGATCSSPQETANVAVRLGLSEEEVRLARWVAILKRDCQTFFGQDFLTVLQEICRKKEQISMRTKQEIRSKIKDLVGQERYDPYDFFKKFCNEFLGKSDDWLQQKLHRLMKEEMQVFDPHSDYGTYGCLCHPNNLNNGQSGWHTATAKTANYEHNNLFRTLLLAELLQDQVVIERVYQSYLQQLQSKSVTWVTDNKHHLLELYDFIDAIDNCSLLAEIAKIVVEIHPQQVYFPCKDGRISDSQFFTYVKRRLLEIQGIRQAEFCAYNLGEDPELLEMIVVAKASQEQIVQA